MHERLGRFLRHERCDLPLATFSFQRDDVVDARRSVIKAKSSFAVHSQGCKWFDHRIFEGCRSGSLRHRFEAFGTALGEEPSRGFPFNLLNHALRERLALSRPVAGGARLQAGFDYLRRRVTFLDTRFLPSRGKNPVFPLAREFCTWFLALPARFGAFFCGFSRGVR